MAQRAWHDGCFERGGGYRRPLRLLLWLAIAPILVGCGPGERARAQICARALSALESQGEALVLDARSAPETPDAVLLRYRLQGAAAPAGERRIVCRFAPWQADRGGLDLEGVWLEGQGELSPIALFLLREYWLDRGEGAGALPMPGDGAAAPMTAVACFLQQLVNAIAPAAVYALLATGYALIYGIIGRINLAFGDFTTVGAFAALSGVLLAAHGAAGLPAAALLGLALALATGTALGAVVFRHVFAPLQGKGSQAALIATVGLAIALGEALRLLARSRQRWLPPLAHEPLILWRGQGGEVALGSGQLLLAASTVLIIGAVLLVMRRSRFGRAYRACADDPLMAALVGIDVGRTTASASMLGGALAGAAGFVLALHYGVVGFAMGTLWGFKALTAAVVGGIGSIAGAALGGLLLGLLESLWAAYLPSAYREVAIFTLLALMLALRPQGLFGQPAAADNPMLRRGRPEP